MRLPPDIEILCTEDGVYLEVEGFINFLKNTDDIPEEYRDEAKHLKKIAEYLESQLVEVLAHKRLLDENLDTNKPN